MFTYIKDHELFILNPVTGKVYRIMLSFNGEDIVVIQEDTLQYQADIQRCVLENKAVLVKS